MGMHSWRGASQKEYVFATYPVILPLDVAGVARFYSGRPIIYAFCRENARGNPEPLYFGEAADGYTRLYLENHGATAAAMAADCTELHVMRLSPGPAPQILADLLAAHPARLNTPVFSRTAPAQPVGTAWPRTA